MDNFRPADGINGTPFFSVGIVCLCVLWCFVVFFPPFLLSFFCFPSCSGMGYSESKEEVVEEKAAAPAPEFTEEDFQRLQQQTNFQEVEVPSPTPSVTPPPSPSVTLENCPTPKPRSPNPGTSTLWSFQRESSKWSCRSDSIQRGVTYPRKCSLFLFLFLSFSLPFSHLSIF